MRLLILTQAVDTQDPVLGFFHRWIEEFAKHCETVHVICLREGEHELPQNVFVHSLGKETGRSRIKYITRFYKYIWELRGEYDSVFVHMNPEYILMGGALWRAWGKKIGLWYVHRQPSVLLRIAARFSSVVFTAAQRSISLKGPKVAVVGHGIDTKLFSELPVGHVNALHPRIVSVGRITHIKNLDVLIRSIALLGKAGIDASLDLIGEPIYDGDKVYQSSLKALVAELKLQEKVNFVGPVPNSAMPEMYAHYDLVANLAPTGGIDKVILEAMASGRPILVSNRSFTEYLDELVDVCMFEEGKAEDLSSKIQTLLQRADLHLIQARLRELARERADVSNVVPAIIERLYGADK